VDNDPEAAVVAKCRSSTLKYTWPLSRRITTCFPAVVEHLAGHAAQVIKRTFVAIQKALQGAAANKLDIHRPAGRMAVP
jgi:hypothetical protein